MGEVCGLCGTIHNTTGCLPMHERNEIFSQAGQLAIEIASLRAQLEEARAALEHQRTALCIIRDRQLGRVSEEDLNKGIRQIDQTLSRLRESCPAKESEGEKR
jgi:hypothetical protein